MSRLGQIARELGRFIPVEAVRAFGRPAAVFFHGVERFTIDARLQTNHHETAEFRRIARTLKREFDVLPLAEISEVLKAPDRHPRAIFLMSDDGYANTLTIAADILEELQLPWSLFVSTHHIDTGERNPVFLALLFAFHAPSGRYQFPHLPAPLVLGDDREAAADFIVRQLRALDMTRAQEAVDAMASALPQQQLRDLLEKYASETFLNWDQVRELRRRGVEIGAHAHRHWPMNASQTSGALRDQALGAKARVERQVGSCRYFSYPFGNKGDVSREAWQAVRDAGYDCAFTTLAGTLDASANRFLLPRFGLDFEADHVATLISMLRAGNARVARFQRELAA